MRPILVFPLASKEQPVRYPYIGMRAVVPYPLSLLKCSCSEFSDLPGCSFDGAGVSYVTEKFSRFLKGIAAKKGKKDADNCQIMKGYTINHVRFYRFKKRVKC
jgi:hypothetical protein